MALFLIVSVFFSREEKKEKNSNSILLDPRPIEACAGLGPLAHPEASRTSRSRATSPRNGANHRGPWGRRL